MTPGERKAVVDAVLAGEPVELAALACGAAVPTVRRWVRRAKAAAQAGIPVADALVDRKPTGRPPAVWKKPGAEEAWLLWRANYLRPEAPTAAGCRRTVDRVAASRGWYVPPTQTFTRRLRAEVPANQVVRAREGRLAALATYPRHRRTVEGLCPLDIVNGDGYKHNLFVRPEGGGEPFRPVTWFWQDVRTRRILAFRSGPAESADIVRLAFRDLVVDHGAPNTVIVDNTRAAANKWFSGKSPRWRHDRDDEVTGILSGLGIRPIHTGVEHEENGKARGHGWAKPVERAFKDLGETIDKHPWAAGAYAGRSPLHKPANYDPGNAIDWELFLRVLADGVAQHNAQEGRRTEAAAGRSFDAVWALEIATTPVRRLTQAQVALLLMAAESTQVRRDGVFRLAAGRAAGLPQTDYWHEDLCGLAGSKVVARFDPQNLHGGVEVFDMKGRWLCRAECLAPVGVADAAAAKEIAREQRRHMKSLDRAYAAEQRVGDLLEKYGVSPAEAAPPARETGPQRVVRMTPQKAGRPDTEKRKALQARLDRGLERMAKGQ